MRAPRLIAPSLFALVTVVTLGSCWNDECEGGQVRCDDRGVIYYCGQRGEVGIVGKPYVWKVGADCGSADRCKLAHGYAFCTLDPAGVPACTVPDGSQCVGEGQLVCEAGYPVAWDYCPGACDAATGKCPVIPGAACDDGGACVGALECQNETCLSRCTCADGEPCADCDAYSQFAGRSNTCHDGWCVYGGY